MKTIKQAIKYFYDRNGRMPSFSEIAELTGYRSKSAVSYSLDKLIKEGFVKKDRKGNLIPVRIEPVRVLGLVEAGFPSPAEEELSDTMSLDDYLIENKEATFMLKVKGDSMIDAGIHEGDMLLVERGGKYKEGSIVVAEVDGEWTVKYLQKEKGRSFLQPANQDYKPIYPKDSLIIAAVVKAVIRKY
jgi:repressor LexA